MTKKNIIFSFLITFCLYLIIRNILDYLGPPKTPLKKREQFIYEKGGRIIKDMGVSDLVVYIQGEYKPAYLDGLKDAKLNIIGFHHGPADKLLRLDDIFNTVEKKHPNCDGIVLCYGFLAGEEWPSMLKFVNKGNKIFFRHLGYQNEKFSQFMKTYTQKGLVISAFERQFKSGMNFKRLKSSGFKEYVEKAIVFFTKSNIDELDEYIERLKPLDLNKLRPE